ncbi:hypothetical protein IFM89_000948 [Coptis chinensis]|uniref:Uncharacterized protein n=1 Tax=Coptis chinensis TaxID=261450 RepID=A0A835IMI2_9MAGN|nr:hypothetical protein IFM89_000948 [Coptis chinensis]
MVKRLREDPSGGAGTWVRGTSTLPKVFDQPNGSKLELLWKDKQPVGPRKHPSLFSESIGVLMATSRRFNWTKNWELQDVSHKQWLWDNIKDSWELDETRKEPTLGPISSDEFRNKKSKWKRKFYTPYTTYEERVSHRPHQLSQQEWVQTLWSFGILGATRARSTPFPRRSFVRTHTSSKTHDALDDQSRDYIEKMNHLASRDEHGAQLPLTNEIYMEVMPPERHGRVRLRGRGVTPTSYFGSRLSSDNRVNDLENQVVEMKIVAEEKEEERQREIEEMRRQAQDKDEQRQREMDEMKRQFDARDADMEARLMQKLLEMTTTRSRLSSN